MVIMGCAAGPGAVLKLKPPVDLMQDCQHPAIRVTKNIELAEAVLSYRAALDLCNNDKAALREWAKD